VNALGSNFHQKPLAQKMQTAEKIAGVIAKMQNPFKQDVLLHHAAAVMQMPFASLKSLIDSTRPRSRHMAAAPEPVPEPFLTENGGGAAVEESAVEAVLLEEKIFSAILGGVAGGKLLRIPDDVLPYCSPRMQNLVRFVEQWHGHHEGAPSVSDLLQAVDVAHKDWAMRVAMQHNNETCFQLFERLVDRFCKCHWQKIVKDIKQQLVKAQQDNDTQKVNDVLERFSQLKQGMMQRGLVR